MTERNEKCGQIFDNAERLEQSKDLGTVIFLLAFLGPDDNPKMGRSTESFFDGEACYEPSICLLAVACNAQSVPDCMVIIGNVFPSQLLTSTQESISADCWEGQQMIQGIKVILRPVLGFI